MKRLTNPVLRHLTEVASLPDLPGARYTLQELLGAGSALLSPLGGRYPNGRLRQLLAQFSQLDDSDLL